MRQYLTFFGLLLAAVFLSSCQTRVVTVEVPVTVLVDSPTVSEEDPGVIEPSTTVQAPPCSEARPGTFLTCHIERAYCDYRPDVDGQPTFCNDAPFPRHSFTLLVWGQDWSDFDGRCLLVTGDVVRFRGDQEIIAESRSQVEICQ